MWKFILSLLSLLLILVMFAVGKSTEAAKQSDRLSTRVAETERDNAWIRASLQRIENKIDGLDRRLRSVEIDGPAREKRP